MEQEPRRSFKLFWWSLGILGILLLGLVLISMASPDSPFSYVLR